MMIKRIIPFLADIQKSYLFQMRDSLKASNRDLKRTNEQINRELEIARSVQQGIYPKNIPDIRGLKLVVTLKQARQVGGDYYPQFCKNSAAPKAKQA